MTSFLVISVLPPRDEEYLSTNMSAPGESGGSCDELDPESENFDSSRALYSEKAEPPCKNVRVYDNLQQYESFIKAAQQGTLRKRLQTQQANRERRQAEAAGETFPTAGPSSGAMGGGDGAGGKRFIVPGRRFTEDQAPVSRPKKQLRSVLTRMEKAIPGPCGRLKWYMDQRVKVKVYTRNFGRVRGVLTGYIVAFDKHWNLCLEDVDEVYQKKVRRKSCFLGDPDDVQLDYQPAPTDPRLRFRGQAPGQVSDPLRLVRGPPERRGRSPSPDREADKAGGDGASKRPGSGRGASLTSHQSEDSSSGDPSRRGRGGSSSSRQPAEVDPEVARLTARMALLEPPRSKRSQRRPVFETGRRHVNQLFVRGDNVVLVAAEDTADAGGDDEVQEVPDDDVREVPDDDVQVVEAQV
ncbi:U7 snRNA-associated Sm-like protein LSm11 [Amphibalanus amphitrite]|uniref:U7 snRNA-associated Sm-like protein LSm11 n=1 Tax=Amphibalanus amphitrite TaxID=1232801 RepID=UPI001C90F05F|nr:U7 snRNA-associated Sm-like protein LSm11 [Amphibalanus amphitrite]